MNQRIHIHCSVSRSFSPIFGSHRILNLFIVSITSTSSFKRTAVLALSYTNPYYKSVLGGALPDRLDPPLVKEAKAWKVCHLPQ